MSSVNVNYDKLAATQLQYSTHRLSSRFVGVCWRKLLGCSALLRRSHGLRVLFPRTPRHVHRHLYPQHSAPTFLLDVVWRQEEPATTTPFFRPTTSDISGEPWPSSPKRRPVLQPHRKMRDTQFEPVTRIIPYSRELFAPSYFREPDVLAFDCP